MHQRDCLVTGQKMQNRPSPDSRHAMHTLPGRVRRFATTSDVPFRLLPCGDTAAVLATDVRTHWQHLVQVPKDPQDELPEYQPAIPPTHGG